MPKKEDKKAGGKSKATQQAKASVKKAGAAKKGKAKKKKWSKGKTREKLNNEVLFDKSNYAKLISEVPKYKLITTSVVSERLKVNGSLARAAMRELQQKGLIQEVSKIGSQYIYTRAIVPT